jgi:hypothetical protein
MSELAVRAEKLDAADELAAVRDRVDDRAHVGRQPHLQHTRLARLAVDLDLGHVAHEVVVAGLVLAV